MNLVTINNKKKNYVSQNRVMKLLIVTTYLYLSTILVQIFTTKALSQQLPNTTTTSSSTSSSSTFNKHIIRVCEGSSCQSKCRGSFTPQTSLERKISSSSLPSNSLPKLEPVFCMNQCKRGPNVRIIRNDQVMTFTKNGVMNDTELNRKSFQSVVNDDRVNLIWGVVEKMILNSNNEKKNGEEDALCDEEWMKESGHVKLLSDLLPES